MNTYRVTASNRYCWQKLAVKASTPEIAEKKFARFLANRDSQIEEGREWTESETIPRSHYVYSFDPDDIAEADNWAEDSKIGITVRMLGKGGNG